MDGESIGLIIFAFTALAAVFAFILVLGGPPQENPTGEVSAMQKPATSTYDFRSAIDACKVASCRDGLNAVPTGQWDTIRELYECMCQTSDPSLIMWRSPYGKAG